MPCCYSPSLRHYANVTRPSWDDYFWNIAEAVSTRADCTRAKVGAVIVNNHRIVATGYNGAPAGGGSCEKGDCPRGRLSIDQLPHFAGDYADCIALHAEQNAIAYANRSDTDGATIYLTTFPCAMCSKLIDAAGITKTMVRPSADLPTATNPHAECDGADHCGQQHQDE